MKDVYATSSPILEVGKRFIMANEIFEGERLNEKVLQEALETSSR